jgi:hypothetical protein
MASTRSFRPLFSCPNNQSTIGAVSAWRLPQAPSPTGFSHRRAPPLQSFLHLLHKRLRAHRQRFGPTRVPFQPPLLNRQLQRRVQILPKAHRLLRAQQAQQPIDVQQAIPFADAHQLTIMTSLRQVIDVSRQDVTIAPWHKPTYPAGTVSLQSKIPHPNLLVRPHKRREFGSNVSIEMACRGPTPERIIRYEVGRGLRQTRVLHRFQAFWDLMVNVPLDHALWNSALDMAWKLDRSGIVLPLSDVIIACAAMRIGAVVLNRDSHFSRVPGCTCATRLSEPASTVRFAVLTLD